MILFPAIDILDGRAVRLRQGEFDDRTSYRDDPLDAAVEWATAGAEWLHVVDLDGARAGHPVNLEHVRRIVARTGLPVQLGGGLRSERALEDALRAGAARLVLGTAAFSDLLDVALEAHPERLVVSVDVRGGRVATSGWTATRELGAPEAVRELMEKGVRAFVYTDVDRDGMLEGPDLEGLAAVAELHPDELIYSGGVGDLADLAAISERGAGRVTGVIVGKALYEGRFSVNEAKAALCT